MTCDTSLARRAHRPSMSAASGECCRSSARKPTYASAGVSPAGGPAAEFSAHRLLRPQLHRQGDPRHPGISPRHRPPPMSRHAVHDALLRGKVGAAVRDPIAAPGAGEGQRRAGAPAPLDELPRVDHRRTSLLTVTSSTSLVDALL